jgi:hypothetical protein
MKCSMPALAALAVVVLAGTAGGENCLRRPPPRAPQRPAAKAPAAVSDPAEPPMTVEYQINPPGPSIPRDGRKGSVVGTLTAASSAAGATLTLVTPGWRDGWATLTFQGAAPMRLTMRLARLDELDLANLSLSSGKLSLTVGPVTATPRTRYFDRKGQAQDKAEGAAYTVTARRWAGGEVDVEVRRAPGAALGRALTVSWRCNPAWRGDLPQ